jgi:hypothetical protein
VTEGDEGQAPASGSPWRRQVPLLVVLVVAGVAMALLWRALTPSAARLGDEQEAAAAVDGSLALLGILAGALTAGFVLVWPGSAPGRRCLAAIGGSIVAGAISWQLGDLLGTPALRAVGAAFTWPVATSGGLFLGALLPWTSPRLNGPDPEPATDPPPSADPPPYPGPPPYAGPPPYPGPPSYPGYQPPSAADGRSEPYAPR